MALQVFPRQLRTLRQARGWTQDELSTASGLTQGEISYLESGRRQPGLGTLMALCAAFGCNPDTLLLLQPEGHS